MANTEQAHLDLAAWCARQGLTDQQRVHLAYALQLNPDSREAIAKLGLARYRGQLVPKALLAALRDENERLQSTSTDWKARLRELRSQLDSRDTRQTTIEALRAIRDPVAIPALESLFGRTAHPDAAFAVVDSLNAMPQQMATESLVRHAIFSPHEEVRKAAAESLRNRDRYAYLPLLLSALQVPIEVRYSVLGNAFGGGHRLELFREGLFSNEQFISTREPPILEPGVTTRRVGPKDGRLVAHVAEPPVRTNRPGSFVNPKTVVVQVEQANEEVAKINTRASDALLISTGKRELDNPLEWWDWRYSENEYYVPENPSTQTYSEYEQLRYGLRAYDLYAPRLQPLPRRSSSCFPAGTLVWTTTGPMRIEQIKIGECVLSQDPESGELAYKPVLATTTRPPSPLIEVRAGDTVIRSTRGHPFWVAGIGWQMAKELKAGQWLHTARGPALIDSAEPSYEAACFNLVVADFNTYFISNAQVLVHDNNLRGPNTATVPGLVKD